MSGTLILNVHTVSVNRIIMLFISDHLRQVYSQSRLFKMVTDKVKEPKKNNSSAERSTWLEAECPNSSLVTVSNGIPSILTFAVADSLKCIFRERERER